MLAAVLPRIRWREMTPLDLAVLAWWVSELIATLASVSPALSVFGEPDQREGLLTSTALAGFYFGLRGARARGARWDVIDAMLAGASLASAYALWQAAGLDPLHWARVSRIGGAVVRPFGTLGNPNLLGAVSAASFAIATVAAIRRARARWLFAPAAALFAATTLLTFSRAAWLGAAVAAAMIAALALASRATRVRRLAWVVAGLGASLALVALAASGWWRWIVARAGAISGGSGASRLEIWRGAIAEWRARPLAGWGPDTFGLVYPGFQTARYWRLEWPGLPVHAHSIVLHVLATRGLLGLIASAAWVAAFVFTTAAAWRSLDSRPVVEAVLVGACALIVAGSFGAIGITGAMFLVALSAIVADAAARPPAAGADARGARHRTRHRAAFGFGALALAIGIALAVREVRAMRSVSQSIAWRRAAPEAAVQVTGAAMAVLPWEDLIARMHAESLEALAARSSSPRTPLASAEATLREAVRRQPLRVLDLRALARVRAEQSVLGVPGAADEASALLLEARRLAPLDAFVLLDLARVQMMRGRLDDALAAAQRASDLYPERGRAALFMANALARAGRSGEARAAIQRALSADWSDDAEGLAAAQSLADSLRGPAR